MKIIDLKYFFKWIENIKNNLNPLNLKFIKEIMKLQRF